MRSGAGCGPVTPRILIIAGSDSGGGAGIQADIKTVTMLGGHAMTAITAITAQNTIGVQDIHPVPTSTVLAQIESAVSDIGIDAVKIGMIGNAQTAITVAQTLARLDVPIVLDPVMVATSGSVLADADTIASLKALMLVATVVTPNLPELAALGGLDAMLRDTARVLVKGGHSNGDTIVDTLFDRSGEVARWTNARIDTRHTHGTGCTLATAIAMGLGAGLALSAAIERASAIVRASLEHAPGLGQGHGPMGQQFVTGFQCLD